MGTRSIPQFVIANVDKQMPNGFVIPPTNGYVPTANGAGQAFWLPPALGPTTTISDLPGVGTFSLITDGTGPALGLRTISPGANMNMAYGGMSGSDVVVALNTDLTGINTIIGPATGTIDMSQFLLMLLRMDGGTIELLADSGEVLIQSDSGNVTIVSDNGQVHIQSNAGSVVVTSDGFIDMQTPYLEWNSQPFCKWRTAFNNSSTLSTLNLNAANFFSVMNGIGTIKQQLFTTNGVGVTKYDGIMGMWVDITYEFGFDDPQASIYPRSISNFISIDGSPTFPPTGGFYMTSNCAINNPSTFNVTLYDRRYLSPGQTFQLAAYLSGGGPFVSSPVYFSVNCIATASMDQTP